MRVTAVGICGSDLHWYDESGIGDAVLTRPLVLGHEAAGVIVDGPRAGQRVAIDPQVPCGACETCAAGRGHLCPQVRFLGHSVTDGAMRELLAWPVTNLVPLPDAIDDAAGAMLEPLGVALHALRLARIRPGDTVAVLGCGPIGLLLIQLARRAGATTVLATDRLPHRVAAARDLGAIAAVVDGGAERDVLLAGDRWAGRRRRDRDCRRRRRHRRRPSTLSGRPAPWCLRDPRPATIRPITASVARRKGPRPALLATNDPDLPQAIALVEAGLVDLDAARLPPVRHRRLRRRVQDRGSSRGPEGHRPPRRVTRDVPVRWC